MGGIASALCLLLMILTIIPIATYTMPAPAGMVLIVVVIENGYSTAWMVYAAVGFLSLFIKKRQCCLLDSSAIIRY